MSVILLFAKSNYSKCLLDALTKDNDKLVISSSFKLRCCKFNILSIDVLKLKLLISNLINADEKILNYVLLEDFKVFSRMISARIG